MKYRVEKLWCVRCVIKGTAYLNVTALARTRSEAIKSWLAAWDSAVKPHYGRWKYWYGTRGYRCVKVEVKEIIKK